MEQINKPSFEKLVDWLEGRLSAPEAEQVAAQVAADETLQTDVAWLQTFHQRRQQIIFAAPPANLRTELGRRFAAHTAENRPPTLWERLTAVLKFDSYTQLAAAAVRSLPSHERQLVYSTNRADVALTIQTNFPDRLFQLYGQVLPIQDETAGSLSAQLVQHQQERWFTMTDEVGEFVLEKIPAGEYELVIGNDQFQIIVPLQLAL